MCVFNDYDGRRYCHFAFEVEVDAFDIVNLDSEEHEGAV